MKGIQVRGGQYYGFASFFRFGGVTVLSPPLAEGRPRSVGQEAPFVPRGEGSAPSSGGVPRSSSWFVLRGPFLLLGHLKYTSRTFGRGRFGWAPVEVHCVPIPTVRTDLGVAHVRRYTVLASNDMDYRVDVY